jgi:hypothetical protein
VVKAVPGERGEVRLGIPRGPLGAFGPPTLPTYQRRLSGFDDTALALSAQGLTTRDIPDAAQELYGVAVAPTLLAAITADRDGEVRLGRSRRRDAVWPLASFGGSEGGVRAWHSNGHRSLMSRCGTHDQEKWTPVKLHHGCNALLSRETRSVPQG